MKTVNLRDRVRSEGILEEPQAVAEPVKGAVSQDFVIRKREQSRAQGHDMPRQISAVHRRNIHGKKWF